MVEGGEDNDEVDDEQEDNDDVEDREEHGDTDCGGEIEAVATAAARHALILFLLLEGEMLKAPLLMIFNGELNVGGTTRCLRFNLPI